MKNELTLYFEAEVEWTEGRKENFQSGDFPLLQIAAPPKFQGHKGLWTPEHRYVASVNSCFMNAFLAFARDSKLGVISFRSKATGKLNKIDDRDYRMTEIVLKPTLVVRSSHELERASCVLQKTEKCCLRSRSIKTKVKVEPEIYTAQLPSYPCPPVTKAFA